MDALARFMDIKDRAQRLPHKDGVYNRDWLTVKSNLLLLLDWLVGYSTKRGVPILITSVIRPRIAGVSVSDTHEDGRAFDISVRGWMKKDIDACVEECNRLYSSIGATGKSNGVKMAAVFEDDKFNDAGKQIKWKHIHFQCAKIVNDGIPKSFKINT